MSVSLEHAVRQKMMFCFAGVEPSPDILATIARQRLGGVTLFRAWNVVDPGQVRALTAALQGAARASAQPPLLIGTDQEGGQLVAIDAGTTLFPSNMALAATRSAELTYRAGQAVARELAAMGVNVAYAPVCDINSDPRNPAIGARSFGEDPRLVAQLTAAMVRGLQDGGVAATAKHFPGLGDTAIDSHYSTPILRHDRGHLERVELPPFAAAIEAGTRLIMAGHGAYPAFDGGRVGPATLSAPLLRGVLRRSLAFEGVIISDSMAMGAIGDGQDLVVDAIAAIAAGIDLLLLGDYADDQQQLVYAGVLQAARRALLDPADVLASAERVLDVKRWVGALPQPPLDVVGCDGHRALATEIAQRSVTLVRDKANLLPLALSEDSRLAVIVPRPKDLTPADTSSYLSCALADALRRHHARVDEFVVDHIPSEADIAAVRQRVDAYDVAIVGTINASMQPAQAALVNSLLRSGVPTVTIALRTPYDLGVFPDAPTYCCAYSIVPCSMEAVAEALVGRIPFRGRLPVSIPGVHAPEAP